MKKILFFVLILTIGYAHAQTTLIINEFSQGASGNKEYIELVVVGTKTCTDSTADIRGWIVDDQNGWYAAGNISAGSWRFANVANWAAVPYGSIIVLYNQADTNPLVPADDPTDANHDYVYILPLPSTYIEFNPSPGTGTLPTFSYPAAGWTANSGTWAGGMALANTSDAVSVVSPANLGAPFHSIIYGYGTPSSPYQTPTIIASATVGSGKNIYLNNSGYTVSSNYIVGNATTNETPGAPNSAANTTWINTMRTPVSGGGTTPTISITTPVTTICSGGSATLTATTNIVGGTFQWQVNGGNVGTNSNTYSYNPANGDNVTCIITVPAGCYTAPNATSNTVTFTVGAPATPTVTITGNSTICAGVNTTYTATPSFTGATYQWQVNGVNVGGNTATYSYVPTNGNTITCTVTTPAGGCFTTTTATSNTINMTVNPNITPSVTITASTNNICSGTPVTFTATSTVAGVSYQWKVNGVNVGGNTATYTYVPTNGQSVTCVVTMPVGGCYTSNTATSNAIIMNVTTTLTPTLTITGNNTVCAGTSVLYTAATNVTGGSFQWQVNGVNVGTNINTYNYIPVNGDNITCAVTTPVGGCYTSTGTNSNAITMTVTPNVTPTITISGLNNVCQGTSVTYTATTNIVGGTYQWQVNGVNVGANSNTYTYVPTSGNAVTCIITVPTGCYTSPNVTSNSIVMTVNVPVVPTISITGSTSPCAGANTYTAFTNVVNGTYQWHVNSLIAGSNSNTFTYLPANGDQIYCTIITPAGGCYAPISVNSSSINIVGNPIAPTLSIHSLTNTDTVCAPLAMMYVTNTNVIGGSYQWQVNGVNVGYNSPAYNYTPTDGDSISCVIYTPASGCYTAASGMSNTRHITVLESTTPTATITGDNYICAGTVGNYTVTSNMPGSSYQWKVNNNNVGGNTATLTYTPTDGDHIICTVTHPNYPPAGPCYVAPAAVTFPFTVTVIGFTPSIAIYAPATAIVGSLVTVHATIFNAGANYSIVWKNNGVTMGTTTVPVFTYTKGTGNDNITAEVTSIATGCNTKSTSNAQLVKVATTGVNEIVAKGGINVYPNPFSEYIVVKGLQVNDKLCVYDLIGRKVTPMWNVDNTDEATYPLSALPTGTYILQIWDANGNNRETLPLVKK